MKSIFTLCVAFLCSWYLAPSSSTSHKSYQTGLASYYAKSLEGHSTASGEPYQNNLLTAAHRKLPFGTLIEVSTPDDSKKVVVRINDRGPFTKGRILDVSRCAAEELGMIQNGVAKVKFKVIGYSDVSVLCQP